MISDPTPLQASIPLFQNIFIMQAETIDSPYNHGIYYGDEINILFWEMLNLKMGTMSTAPYTLMAGYKYIYYVENKRFVIYDANSAIVYEKKDVVYISDFCIDIEIYKSHQLEIHLSPYCDVYSFFKVARLKYRAYDVTIEDIDSCGINNMFEADRVRPYLADDVDNPLYKIFHIADIDFDDTKQISQENYRVLQEIDETGIKNGDIDFASTSPSGIFYEDMVDTGATAKLAKQVLFCEMVMYNYMLPNLSTSLYPGLMPVERSDETQNNRPVYEPWLIYGLYKFIYSKRTSDDIDSDFEIYSFDLSPVYS